MTDTPSTPLSENTSPQSDQALMLAYGRGDAAAFETLYHRHKDGLYRYILRQLGNDETANDVFQDVWGKVIQAREQYQVKAQFKTWLYRIAHNRIIDVYRAQGRFHEWEATAREEDLPDASIAMQSPETFTSRTALAKRLKALLAALPPPQREALLLKEEGGFSLDEMAALLGEEKETIKSRLRYATQKLRQHVDPDTLVS